jgi:LPXTG-motif cell wall-anchored protein
MPITFGVKPLNYTATNNTTIPPYVVGSVSNIATQPPKIVAGATPTTTNNSGGFLNGFSTILGGLVSAGNTYANIVNAQNTNTQNNNTNVATPPYVLQPQSTNTGGTQTNYGEDAPPKKNNTTTIVLVVVGVIILGLGIWFLTKKK